MRNMILAAAVAALGVAASAEAQVKRQPFVGVSAVAPRVEGAAPATTVHGGFALVVPVTSRLFLRPVVTVAAVSPTFEGKKNFASVAGSCLVGWRVNPSFAVLGGYGMTFNFVPDQPTVKLRTLSISTATKIGGHWGIYTPVAITPRSIAVGTQLGYTW